MNTACERCQGPIFGGPVITVTGRRICPTCDQQSWGLAAARGYGRNASGQSLLTYELVQELKRRILRHPPRACS